MDDDLRDQYLASELGQAPEDDFDESLQSKLLQRMKGPLENRVTSKRMTIPDTRIWKVNSVSPQSQLTMIQFLFLGLGKESLLILPAKPVLPTRPIPTMTMKGLTTPRTRRIGRLAG